MLSTAFCFLLLACGVVAFAPAGLTRSCNRGSKRLQQLSMQGDGLKIDMRGKTVFVAGVADSTGYGWAIAKACAEAGATILLGTWCVFFSPPVLTCVVSTPMCFF